MKASKKNKIKRPMSPTAKIMLCVLGLALVVGIVYLSYYLITYVMYDRYEDFLTSYEYEEGTEFKAAKEASSDVENMVLVCENDSLKLYTNTETADVAIYDKRNGEIVYSNPVNADADSVANAVNIDYLKSQFILNYYTKDVNPGVFDSYSMSVERGQVTYEAIENGIRYLYTVGDFSSSKTGNLPIYITQEKLDEVASKLPEKDATSLYRYYSVSETVDGMMELNGVIQKNVKTLAKMKDWFAGIGWTDEDYNEQMELAGVEPVLPISFVVPLEYRLEEDGVKVSIPVSGIEEYGGGAIYRIQLLRYMGAASTDENGYLVVPNGSGSIINFNNGKVKAASYSQYVYDIDPLAANFTTVENTQTVKLSLFGICRENSSVLATIEDGASLAMINAGVSGVYNDYNYAYPSFILRTADNLLMFGDSASDVYVMEPDAYDVNLSVKYTLLTEENKGYDGLANYYREKLIEQGKLALNEETGDIPFYYDVIGGVKETAHLFGVQYLRTFAMTTFEQAEQMSNEFAEAGISNQVMNFQGWMNGGYYHDTVDKVRVTSKLGGKKGLENLSSTVEANGGKFYADAAISKVTFADDGFNYNAEGARYYGAGYVASFGLVNPTTLRATSGLGYMENKYDILSPKYLPRYVEKYANKVEKIDIGGVAMRDLGNYLSSDKKRTNIIHREEALDILLAQWDTLAETEKSLMADAANDYTFAYVEDIINAPITDNDFPIVDEDIPLYEMILHGCVNYSSSLLNYYDDEDMDKLVLNLIEYGASPHYVFTWEESSRMKKTAMNRYYSTTFAIWKQEAMDIYGQVNEALQHVNGAEMTGHEILDNDVRKVTYSNGVIIYLNYSEKDQNVDGKSIPAKSYRMEGI